MLDIRYLTDHTDEARARLARRGTDAHLQIDRVAAMDTDRRKLQHDLDDLRATQKQGSRQVGDLMKSGRQAEGDGLREEMKALGDRIRDDDIGQKRLQEEIDRLLLQIPNLPSETTPVGTSSAENPVVRTWGDRPSYDFQVRPHWQIGEDLGILDFGRAAKLAGARFTVYMGAGALLERALIGFMLDLHTREHGYTEVLPPVLVNRQTMTGTGQLPKFEADMFRVPHKVEGAEGEMDLFLVPTAEVPLTNLYADEILDGERLPILLTAHTPCFRKEAGSYGKDTRGLIRQHQFNKVELVWFSHPDKSYEALEQLTRDAEEVLQRLGLHYRVVSLCSGDIGFSSTKTYDLEVWLPGQDAFREISSCSNCEDFQARRAKIRFRDPNGKPRLVHTLNGSGIAVGRTVVAILEQNQLADGTVRVPEALRPYMGGMDTIRARH